MAADLPDVVEHCGEAGCWFVAIAIAIAIAIAVVVAVVAAIYSS